MNKKILYTVVSILGFLLLTATNGFSFGSYGNTLNNDCAPAAPYTGSCLLCHDGVLDSNPTPAKTAYLAGITNLTTRTDFFCPSPTAALDPLTAYDDFNDKKYNGVKYGVNSQKWIGSQQGSVTEIQREIKAKRVRLSNRTWGNGDSDLGLVEGRNQMQFGNSVNMSGACFVPRIKKYEVQDCDANAGSSSDVQIGYAGNFYNALGGTVYAGISMRRVGNSADKKALFEVVGFVDDSTDPLWNLSFGTVKAANNKKAMCVGYDRTNQQFVFSFGNDVKTVSTNVDGLPAYASDVTADVTRHVIETQADVQNCSAGAISGYIDADFDKVMIREFQ